jgi:hypothetical protein
VIVVFGACAAAVALPAGLAESATSSPSAAPNNVPIVSVTLCGGGVNVGVLGVIGVTIGQSCAPAAPTPSPTPTAVDICTLPPPPSSPPPTPTPTPTPAAVVIKPKPSPRAAVIVPAPPSLSPSHTPPKAAAAVVTPKPTPPKPTPKAAPKLTPTPVMAQLPQAYHAAVPFRRLSPVLILFVVAIVPISLARIRHAGSKRSRR